MGSWIELLRGAASLGLATYGICGRLGAWVLVDCAACCMERVYAAQLNNAAFDKA